MGSTYYQTLTLVSHTGETGSFTVFNDEVTALNLVGQLARWDRMKTAVNAQCFNNVDKNLTVFQSDNIGVANPASNYAVVENKLRIVYKSGDTSKLPKLFQIEVPCIDLAKVKLLNTGTRKKRGPDPVAWLLADGATAQTIELIAAFVDQASIPDDPNDGFNSGNTTAVVIVGVYFVND